jgi:hypothetical protein
VQGLGYLANSPEGVKCARSRDCLGNDGRGRAPLNHWYGAHPKCQEVVKHSFVASRQSIHLVAT